MEKILNWASAHLGYVVYGFIILVVLILVWLASYKDTTLVKTDAQGYIDISPEWENTTYNYRKADFVEYDVVGSFFSKSKSYKLLGFYYDKKYYTLAHDCSSPVGDDDELYDYDCRRDDDEQNYYVRINKYPDGSKPLSTINQ